MNKIKLFGKNSIGSWLQMPNRYSAEIMAKSGFDWLAIDMEHGLIDVQKAFELIQVVELAGSIPLVRLNENNPSLIRRVMDAGAKGVIVPMVNTAEDAQKAVDAVKYPPDGKRSYGLGRAHEFGKNFSEYIKTINTESIVVVQIEHINAFLNLDSILGVKSIDAIIIGPYDLSGSMGIAGKFDDDKFQEAVNKIIEKVKKHNIALGIHIVHPSLDDLKQRVSQGFSFIGFGMDTIFLSDGCAKAIKECRKIIK